MIALAQTFANVAGVGDHAFNHLGKGMLQIAMARRLAAPIRLTASHSGGFATSYQPLRMETRVCPSYLSACSDMLLLVCVAHTSQ